MLSRKEIVEKIQSIRFDLNVDDIEKLIARKKEEFGELLTDEGASYLVANDLKIALIEEKTNKLLIKDLPSEANDVTVNGKVISIYPIKTFQRKDGSNGQVCSFIIRDETGFLRVILWDDKTEIIKKIGIVKNSVVRISHGYIKKSLNGHPELNAGKRTELILLNSLINNDDSSLDTFKKIQDINEFDFLINTMGIARRISKTIIFKHKDGSKGKLLKLRLVDETGKIDVAIWDEKVDSISGIHLDNFLKIMGGEIRKGQMGLEIQVGKESDIIIQREFNHVFSPRKFFIKMRDLTPGMNDVDFLGVIIFKGLIKKFTDKSGKMIRVLETSLKDETSSIKISFWDDHVDLIEKISVGEMILVEGANVKNNLSGIEANLGTTGAVYIKPDIIEAEDLQNILKK